MVSSINDREEHTRKTMDHYKQWQDLANFQILPPCKICHYCDYFRMYGLRSCRKQAEICDFDLTVKSTGTCKYWKKKKWYENTDHIDIFNVLGHIGYYRNGDIEI